ncbi:Exportin-6 [Nymphon striatum]|nr:Exportin-6 [Nymphon striatum]
MQASDEQSLRALETLMNEFFDGNTSNVRKREIEQLLNSFSQQRDSWQHCLYYMTNTQNEYVMMYCCTVIESLINKQWVGLPGESKATIRPLLSKFLLSQHKRVPHFIRNKLCKLIVDIGRLDWPHFYPDFLSNTLQLVQQSDTVFLGLILLQTTSEELACPRDDLSVSRKEELHHLLFEHVPNILSILNGVLELAIEKSRIAVTATPPPSPTHSSGDEQSYDSQQQILFSTSPLHHGSLLNSMFKSLTNKNQFRKCPSIVTKECHELITMTLTCLSQFLNWIPLSGYITPGLMMTVFHLASFGCHVPSEDKDSANRLSKQPDNNFSSIGVLAMCCINEIMSKNCVPSEFEDFFYQIFQYSFHLLQLLTKDNNCHTSPNSNILSVLNENYIEKFTEFLRLFVSSHFNRFEEKSQFPVLEFLALLFKYTFQQPSNEGFFSCLDIWAVFIDYLYIKLSHRSTNSDVLIYKYKDALLSLVTHITQKYQFKFNQSQLEELDADWCDDNNETEWQNFLRQCIEIIARVSDLLPIETFNLVESLLQQNSSLYQDLQSSLRLNSLNSSGQPLGSLNESEYCRLHCILRDLSSTLQTVGRFSNHFIGENFSSHYSVARLTVKRLCDIVIFSSKLPEFYANSNVPLVLKTDFIEVHAQALASLKAFTHWMAEYYMESLKQKHLEDDAISLIQSILQSTITVIDKNVPEKITHSAAHLLMSITSTVRPSFINHLPAVQSLLNIEKFQNLVLESQLLVYRSISNILLLPWPFTSEINQQWEQRLITYSSFIKSVTSTFFMCVQNIPDFAENKKAQEEAKPAIKWTLRVLQGIVESHGDSVLKTKQNLYQNIYEPVEIALQLFSVYINQFVDVNFSHLPSSQDQVTMNILQEDSSGIKVVEKFLNILQLIVREPGSAFQMFLPDTLKLCMSQIYPVVAQRPSPDVKIPLFELLYNILSSNWTYFFKSNVVSSLGQSGNEYVLNQDDFVNIMQAFGQSFLQPDINIFKQNLRFLDKLNSSCRLYSKCLFKEVMMTQFLKVFIMTLVHKSHDLLQEEIGISIYNMASVNFDHYYNIFIINILSECKDINEEQRNVLVKNLQHETDMPSFMKNLNRFVGDLRCYELCNLSLAPGSVTF